MKTLHQQKTKDPNLGSFALFIRLQLKLIANNYKFLGSVRIQNMLPEHPKHVLFPFPNYTITTRKYPSGNVYVHNFRLPVTVSRYKEN
jgi:hypothetical protein